MNEEDLTARQREVVDSEVETTLVLGDAGSGKTTVALWAARAELLRPHVKDSQRVAFITFSRTAVNQIRSRSRAALQGIGNRVDVFTFHAFSLNLIRAYGRYFGMGPTLPMVQSEASGRLFGTQPGHLRYRDLLPAALRIVDSDPIADSIAARWPLVICDEFQDTSEEQWQLLQILGSRSRRILLADPDQMIYTFVPGVSPARMEVARRESDVVVELEPSSKRDPSGVIPTMASAIRHRRFADDAVRRAIDDGRLSISKNVQDEELVDVIRTNLKHAWSSGCASFGIFAHSNDGVARLGQELIDAGIEHTLVGLPDAQVEALSAMMAMVRYSFRLPDDRKDIDRGLASFLTACTRGRDVPDLAKQLVSGRAPDVLEERIRSLAFRLQECSTLDERIQTVIRAWSDLGITAGQLPWDRTAPVFAAAARRSASLATDPARLLHQLEVEVRATQTGALLAEHGGRGRAPATQLMNFHQTKGREADAIILVYRDGDYLAGGSAIEPFEDASRVLYVSLTRARRMVTVILPPDPHPLVRPFAQLN